MLAAHSQNPLVNACGALSSTSPNDGPALQMPAPPLAYQKVPLARAQSPVHRQVVRATAGEGGVQGSAENVVPAGQIVLCLGPLPHLVLHPL